MLNTGVFSFPLICTAVMKTLADELSKQSDKLVCRGTAVAVKLLFANCQRRKRRVRKWSDLVINHENESNMLNLNDWSQGGISRIDSSGADRGGSGGERTGSSPTVASGQSSTDEGMVFSLKVANDIVAESETARLWPEKLVNLNGRLAPLTMPNEKDRRVHRRVAMLNFRKEIRFFYLFCAFK